jgi:hypothetical protein
MLKMTSMAGSLGALPAGPAASTTEVEEDVNGGPPRRCYRWVRQRPPPMLKMSMAPLPAGPAGSTIKVEEDINGAP